MSAFSSEIKEVIAKIDAASMSDEKANFADHQSYVGTKYVFAGLKSATQNRVFNEGFSFSTKPILQQLEIWNAVWLYSNHFEAMTLAWMYWDKHWKKMEANFAWEFLEKWVGKIDNWAHSDGLSSTYSRIFKKLPDVVFEKLVNWNESSNLWERRQSLVVLLIIYRKKDNPLSPDRVFPFIDNLLGDKEYFVQKAVGWALREAGKPFPKITENYLFNHAAEISSTAFSAAAEKMEFAKKEELKSLRKLLRKK